MRARRQRFARGLRERRPMLLPGAYDAMSAMLVEHAGFDAVYIGSFASAASAYGLPDVGLLTLTEMVEQARRVVGATSLPVLTDGENGFYDAPNLWRAVAAFEAAGVAGIHLEDNLGGKHSSAPAGLLPRDAMVQKIRAAVDARTDPDFVIIARSDALWVNKDLDDCVARLEAYAAAGADAVFPTGITAAQLSCVRHRFTTPVMALGDLPDAAGEDYPSSSLREYEEAGADLLVLFYFGIGAAACGVSRALDELQRTRDVQATTDLVESQVVFESRMGYNRFAERSARYAGTPDA
ncbi:isocitrate lyase/PEP mutase family protein [Pseudonocardia sichuanensis]